MSQRSTLLRYQVVMALRWLGVGAVAPFVFILMQERGLTLAEIGVTVAVYGLTVAVLELPTGGMADALGRRPVLAAASTITLCATLVLFLAESQPVFLVGWALLGVGRALDSGALEAWFVDESLEIDPEINLSSGLAAGEVAGAIALAVGSLLGGFVPAATGLATNGGILTGLSLPILLGALAGACHLVAVLLLIDESGSRTTLSIGPAIREAPVVVRSAVRLAAHHHGIRKLVAATAVIGIAASSVEVLWQPHFAYLSGSVDTRLFGMVGAALFAAAAAGAAAVPWSLRRLKGSRGAAGLFTHLGAGACILMLAAANAVLPAAVALSVVYLFVGIRGPIHNELIHRRVASANRSTMLSADSLSLQLGGFGAALVIPRLADAWSIPWAWLLVALLVILAGWLYPSAARSSEHVEEHPAAGMGT